MKKIYLTDQKSWMYDFLKEAMKHTGGETSLLMTKVMIEAIKILNTL